MTDQETIFEYLDELRESGATSMYGAGAYLQRDFGLDSREAMKLTLEWMNTFEERRRVRCNFCGGSGTVPEATLEDGLSGREVICSECNGSGAT